MSTEQDTLPRYYFHLHDGQELLDDEGVLIGDDSTARAEAIRAAGEMLRDTAGRLWNGEDWRMLVVKETGETVCSLYFSLERGAPKQPW